MKQRTRGMSLIEAIVAIGLAGSMLVAFGTAIYSTRLRTAARHRSQATALAVGEIAAIRARGLGGLANRTDEPFIEFTMNRGTVTVKNQALEIREPAPEAAGGITNSVVIPTDRVGTLALTATIRVGASQPAGWRVGFAIRSRDLGNQYRYTIGASTVTLEKMVDGAATTLYADTIATNPGDTVTFGITASGGTFTLTRQGQTIGSASDGAFASGDLALIALQGALASYDDITVAGDAAASWNFDADAAGAVPTAWKRLALTDLPAGTDELTILDAFTGSTLKKITARVRWQSTRGSESVEAVTYLK